MTWNYRLVTYIYYRKPHPAERIFKICSVYYDKDGKLESYGEGSKTDSLDGWENVEDLKMTLDLIQKAVEKPIIDLDHFPNIWDDGKK